MCDHCDRSVFACLAAGPPTHCIPTEVEAMDRLETASLHRKRLAQDSFVRVNFVCETFSIRR
jgi:hypothetical protein